MKRFTHVNVHRRYVPFLRYTSAGDNTLGGDMLEHNLRIEEDRIFCDQCGGIGSLNPSQDRSNELRFASLEHNQKILFAAFNRSSGEFQTLRNHLEDDGR